VPELANTIMRDLPRLRDTKAISRDRLPAPGLKLQSMLGWVRGRILLLLKTLNSAKLLQLDNQLPFRLLYLGSASVASISG
jgi:hypothetical protein